MRSLLKFVAGAIAGGLLWFYATPAYNGAIAAVVTPLLRLDSRLARAHVERAGRNVEVRRRDDLEFPPVKIPADQLTHNVILFSGLVAVRRGNLKRTALAALIVAAGHVVAFGAAIEATYATKLEAWSEAHYGGTEQDFWTAVEYLYRLAGMFAIAFAAWWMSLSAPEGPGGAPTAGRRPKRA